MKKQIYTFTLVMSLYGCSRQELSQMSPTSSERDEITRTSPSNLVLANNVSVTYTDESSFVESLAMYDFKSIDQLNLNRQGQVSGYNSTYGFNIPADRQVKGFKWNKGDQDTKEWRPQGITGFERNGKTYLITTWYGVGPSNIPGVHNQHKGVRVSLVDITNMSNITYRHILLVQNKENMGNSELYRPSNPYTQLEGYAPVTIHAGGVAYYDGKIYVADTRLGIRVFDLDKFISAEGDVNKNKIGVEHSSTLKAFDYGYILPQIGYYKITDGSPFSCIALGEGSTSLEKRLWTGQYLAPDAGRTPTIYGFPINEQGQLYGNVESISPLDKYDTPVYRMQGVYRSNAKTVMTTTGNGNYEGSTARLVRYSDGTAAATRYRWPHGAEDLYLDTSTGLLWNLTEYETEKYGKENRAVFAVRYADYD
ncbi:hypothetical protein H8S90_00650 [Olivibacter sp. SDN3]|uniref:hypothetical protein n=1 Tax=Olivibacter sp. SDN3 TaxID=2764720 RepID=UPI00165195F6|nr:hypothetical protein [Olivibacter sp. SDN3]QNL50180.1 hypothetical protein H8S90_00650 [Olivibacter sp. SDN3]